MLRLQHPSRNVPPPSAGTSTGALWASPSQPSTAGTRYSWPGHSARGTCSCWQSACWGSSPRGCSTQHPVRGTRSPAYGQAAAAANPLVGTCVRQSRRVDVVWPERRQCRAASGRCVGRQPGGAGAISAARSGPARGFRPAAHHLPGGGHGRGMHPLDPAERRRRKPEHRAAGDDGRLLAHSLRHPRGRLSEHHVHHRPQLGGPGRAVQPPELGRGPGGQCSPWPRRQGYSTTPWSRSPPTRNPP